MASVKLTVRCALRTLVPFWRSRPASVVGSRTTSYVCTAVAANRHVGLNGLCAAQSSRVLRCGRPVYRRGRPRPGPWRRGAVRRAGPVPAPVPRLGPGRRRRASFSDKNTLNYHRRKPSRTTGFCPALVPISAGRVKIGGYFRRPPHSWCLFPPAACSSVVPVVP